MDVKVQVENTSKNPFVVLSYILKKYIYVSCVHIENQFDIYVITKEYFLEWSKVSSLVGVNKIQEKLLSF